MGKSLMGGADADKAYSAFLTFKDVVKKNQVTSAGPAASAPSGDKIGDAAKKLSDASYPFLKEIDWTSDLFMKPLPGASSAQLLKAVDKAIVMGSAMDGNLLKAAAEAHHKAIGSIDSNGVTSAADYEAVNAALGRVVASVPTSKVMDVYNSFAAIVNPAIPNKMFSMVSPLDANAAAKAFYEFKDAVRAAQWCTKLGVLSKLLMFGHGRVVHGRAVRTCSKLSSGMHCTVESHTGKSCGQE